MRKSSLDSAVFLAAGTAFLYCAGTAHFNAYLRALNLDSDVLDRSFHQVLYSGFLVSFTPAFTALVCYAVLRFVYSHALLPAVADYLRHSIPRRRRAIAVKRFLRGKRKDSLRERQEKIRSIRVIAYATAAALFIGCLVYFELRGRDAARETERNSEGNVGGNWVRAQIEGETRTLNFLACGARNCAGIDPESKTIYYFPQNGHAYKAQDRASKVSMDSL